MMRPFPHVAKLRLPLRPHPATALPRQWRQRAYASDDSKLHPNPNVVPSTDPQSPRPSANPARADHAGTAAEGARSGHPSPDAQSNMEPKGPNMDQLPHVSEESAAMGKSMGTGGPSMEQGTPVGEVVKDDKEAEKNLPKVMRDALQKQDGPSGSRSFSTSTRRRVETMTPSQPPSEDPTFDMNAALRAREAEDSIPSTSTPRRGKPDNRQDQDYPGQWYEINEEEAMMIARREVNHPEVGRAEAQLRAQLEQGLKFAEPSVPREKQRHLRRRYQGIVEQVTNMIMRHGMKARAQKNMGEILTHLRTTSAPSASSSRRLLPLPPQVSKFEDLPRNPVAYLTYAIDAIGPLLRIRSLRGMAGGGASLPLPQPMELRQRRRTAIAWILDAVEKRKGGTSNFPKRFGEEIVSILEGRSSIWAKRDTQHRMAVAARANMSIAARKMGRKNM